MIKASVVVPCFNEKDNLTELIGGFQQALKNRQDIKIIVVDNGSTDGSSQFLNSLILGDRRFHTIRIEHNQGYGHGILTGLNACQSEILGWTHGDLQTPPADVLQAIDILLQNQKTLLVRGARKQRPWFEKFFSLGMSFATLLRTGFWISEINAQPKIFPRELFDQVMGRSRAPFDFSFDLFFVFQVRCLGFSEKFISVDFLPRINGEAKGSGGSLKAKMKIIRRTIPYIWRLRKGKGK